MNWNDLTMAQKNELMQTYIKNGVTSLDDMRSHFNSFATGGPKDPPTVLPVNEEGLPYYTLPDVDIVAEALPQAKATDASIQRYADAVANGQIKLTQIPNTELRNRVRAKPIVDQIMRDRDKTLAPILMGTVGMPAAIIGGISAAPTVATIMNNPIVDAGLTIQGAITAPKNIKEGVQEIREGEYGRGALDLGLTALDIWGAGNLAHKAARIANPAYRAKHAYNTIAPAGYGDASKRFKEWAKDLWNNPEIDYANPKWLKKAKTKKSIDVERFGYTGTGSYLEDDIVNAGKIADEARQDAWAIYNGLPQVHGTYIKNADGTYSYNMKKIMEDSKGTWHPAHAPLSTGQKAAMHDFVTGAGGGLTDFRLTQTGEHGNGVMHLEDVWDLHPFSRTGDKISQRFAKELREKIGSQTRRDAVQNFRKKMFDKGIFGFSNKGIQRATYPINRLLNRYRMGEFAPKFNIGEYEAVVGLSDKFIYDLSKSKAMSKLSDKMKSFEVGSISGGKPFKMSTDIPFHRTNPYEEMIEGIGDAEKYYQMSSSGEPILLQGQLKYGFNPLWIKDLHPVIPESKYQEFIKNIVN